MRRTRRWLAVLFLLALVLALPLLVNLEVFRQQARRLLERQLGRPIEFARLTAQLLPRPALVGRRVQVAEQDRFGPEPFLYAEEVTCDLPLRSIWTWRWQCSEIHFEHPSFNLVHQPGVGWNLGMFLLGGVPGGGAAGASVSGPIITASAGRLNLKLGFDKQVYALTDLRLRLEPRPDGRWRLDLEATPARGDLRLTETGTVRLEGEVGRAADFAALPFRFQVSLPRGSLAQLVALATGREPPVRAQVALAATLEGTPAEWRAQGTLTVADLRHQDLVASPRSPRWQGEFDLKVADHGRAVELEQVTLHAQHSQISLTGRVDDVRGSPRWNLEVTNGRLDLDELLAQWAGLKDAVPSEARLKGVARLRLRAEGPLENWQGELAAAEDVALQVPGLPAPVELAALRLRLGHGRLELTPLTLRFSPQQALTLSGDWRFLSPGAPYRLRWQSQGVELEPLQKAAAALGWDVFGPTRWQGRARLDLNWHGQAVGGAALDWPESGWQGQAELQEVKFHPPEFNQPLDILEARLAWRGRGLQVQPLVLRLGEDVVTGSLEWQPTRSLSVPQSGTSAGLPARIGPADLSRAQSREALAQAGRWTVKLSAGQLHLGDLDELLNPARRSLIARLVAPETRPAPRWLDLIAAGEMRVEELYAGPFRLRQVQAQGQWQAGRLELTRLRCATYGGRLDARLQGDFRPALPQYRLAGNLKQVDLAGLLADSTELGPLFSGMAGADLSLQTQGLRSRDLLRNLQGRVVGVVHDGAITHLDLLAALAAAAEERAPAAPSLQGTELQSLAGDFRVADEQVELDAVRLIVDGAALELSGRVQFDGTLDLRLRGEPLLLASRAVPPGRSRAASPSAPSRSAGLPVLYRLTGSLQRPQVERTEPPPAESPR